jgi:hypothetical protein
MRIIKILFCFLIGWPFLIFAQGKADYHFVVQNDKLVNSANSYDLGKEFEFTYQRILLGKNIFRERGLFSEDTLHTVEIFKIVSGRWYFKYNEMWYLFFDGSNKVNSKFYISGIGYRLNWRRSNSRNLYDLIIKPIGISVSDIPRYIFSPQNGIIAISGEVTLIREDLKGRFF